MNQNQRKSTETQKQYKERLREQNKSAKGRTPRLLWDSHARGTYVRERHGELA